MHLCKICKIEKPLEEFYIRKNSGKPRHQCITCFHNKSKTDWILDPIKHNARQLKYKLIREGVLERPLPKEIRSDSFFNNLARQHNTRAESLGIPTRLVAKDLWRLALKQRLICPYTRIKLTRQTISLDHIIPLSKEGTNDITNVCFIYRPVNYAKRDMSKEDFIGLCKLIVSCLN